MPIARSAYSSAPLSQPGLLAGMELTLPGKAFLALSASAFIALAAHVSFPLPFTPVPLTLGNMAVVLVALFLSPATAFAALLLYLAEGALGLPVFTPGGLDGVARLAGPTAGFLFAYPFAALLTSSLLRVASRLVSRFASALVAAALGTALVLLCGAAWLAALLHLGASAAVTLGVAPFLPGEIVKVLASAGIFASLTRWRRA